MLIQLGKGRSRFLRQSVHSAGHNFGAVLVLAAGSREGKPLAADLRIYAYPTEETEDWELRVEELFNR